MWRSTLIFSVFRRSTRRFSFLPLLRSSTLQTIQTKVLSLSKFSQKLSFSSSRNVATEQGEEEPEDKTSMDRELHVGNLLRGRDGTTDDTLFRYFSQYGEIEVLEFFRQKFTNLPRGFAFVTFRDVESAKRVLAESHIIDGRNVTIGVPVNKQKSAVHSKKDSTVLVKNIMKHTSKEVLAEHFCQFGKVDKVILAQKGQYDGDGSSYYVLFSSFFGAKKALEKPTQIIADQGIDSQVTALPTSPQTKEYIGRTNCLGITSIPDSVTVEDLREYFQQFGDVEFVDFVVHSRKIAYSQKPQDSSAAFVRFSDEATVEEVMKNKNHIISGSAVKASKYRNIRAPAPETMRELKVSVEGLPLSIKHQEVKEYFEQTFGVILNGVFFKEPHIFDEKLFCIVRFSNKVDLERVLKEPKATFHGCPLYFRRLVWKN